MSVRSIRVLFAVRAAYTPIILFLEKKAREQFLRAIRDVIENEPLADNKARFESLSILDVRQTVYVRRSGKKSTDVRF